MGKIEYDSGLLLQERKSVEEIMSLLQQASRENENVSFIVSQVGRILEYYEEVKSKLENVEEAILGLFPRIITDFTIHIGFTDFEYLTNQAAENYFKTHYYREHWHTTWKESRSLSSYLKNGVCLGGSIQYSSIEAKQYYSNGIFGIEAKEKVGYAKVYGDIKASLFYNGRLDPNIHGVVGVHAEVGSAQIEASLGSASLGLHGDASVSVGTIDAEAQAILSKEELVLKAEIGAAAIEGEVGGGFSIFGYTIHLDLSGEFLGVGAGFECSATRSSLEIGSNLSFLIGGGFKVKIQKEGE